MRDEVAIAKVLTWWESYLEKNLTRYDGRVKYYIINNLAPECFYTHLINDEIDENIISLLSEFVSEDEAYHLLRIMNESRDFINDMDSILREQVENQYEVFIDKYASPRDKWF